MFRAAGISKSQVRIRVSTQPEKPCSTLTTFSPTSATA